MNTKSSVRHVWRLLVAAFVTHATAHGISLVGVPSDLNLLCEDPIPAPAQVTFTGACSTDPVPVPMPELVRSFPIPSNANGITVTSNGNIYVAYDTHVIRAYNPSGTLLFSWGSFGGTTGKFYRPAQLAVDAANRIYVADRDNNRVQIFNSDGSFVRAFGGYGSTDGKFNLVDGVGVNRQNGNILVADRSNHRVQVFDHDGNFLFKFGSYGSTDGLLDVPGSVEVDPSGRIYVTDLNGNRLQVFDAAGNHIETIATGGTAAGQLVFPRDMAIDPRGFVYVADTQNNRIQAWDFDGNLLGSFGKSIPGFTSPHGISVDVKGYVYVVDASSRVLVFAPLATDAEADLTTGLVLHYSFDRNDGNVTLDESGFGRTGIVHEATWIADGVRGGAYRFDHPGHYISSHDFGLPSGGSSRTLSWWFTVPAIHTDGGSDMFSYGTQSNGTYFYFGVDWRQGRRKLAFSPWGWVFLSSAVIDQPDTWYHAVFTYGEGGAKKFYINGVEQSGYSEGGSIQTTLSGLLRIGPHAFSQHPFTGKVDEVRMYNRVLTSNEVAVLHDHDAGENVAVVFAESSTGDCPRVITRTWTVTDLCGHTASATQTITAAQPPPIILSGVPEDITVECGESIPEPPVVTVASVCAQGGDVSKEGLILHYKFDDEQNLGLDSGNLGQNGVVSGVVYNAYGHQGGSGQFGGQGQKIRAAHLPQPGYELSWGAWVLPEGNSLYGVMGKTVAANESFYLHVRPGEKLAQAYVVPQSRTEERYARNFGIVQTGRWHHVMGTYDGNVVSLYLNGQLVHTNYYANRQMVRSNNVIFAVGDVGVGMGWSYKGLIDDVRVYARTLSGAEVASIAGVAASNEVEVAYAETISGTCPAVITRVWSAYDACGNSVSATQTITVVAPPPPEPPTLVGVPDDVTVKCGQIPSPPEVTATGGCPSPSPVDGLVLYYPFNENLGSIVLDASGNNRTGVVHGTTWIADGIRGGAIRYDNGEQHIVTSDAGLPAGNSPRTFAMWVRMDHNYPNESTGYFRYGTQDFNQLNALGFDWRSNRDNFNFSQYGGVFLSSQKINETGKWYHVVYTYNGSGQHSFYIDGVPSSGLNELSGGINTVPGGVLQLGGLPLNFTVQGPQGYLDDVMILNRAVSADEALALYQRDESTTDMAVAYTENISGTCPAVITRVWTATDGCGVSVSATQTITVVAPPPPEPPTLVGVPDDVTVACGNIPLPANVTAASACEPLSTNGLALHYTFDHVDGEFVIDQSASGYNGTVVGATHEASGKFGGAMRFDGNDYIDAGNVLDVGGDIPVLTAAIWFKSAPAGTASYALIGKNQDKFDPYTGWCLRTDPRPTADLIADFPQRANAVFQTNLYDNTWHHMAGIFEVRSNTLNSTLFVDGVQVATGSWTGNLATTKTFAKLRLGNRDPHLTEPFVGLLDEARVYTRGLTLEEVQALYQNSGANIDVQLTETREGECPAVITRVWTATDACGSSVSATQTITVVAPPPPEPPTLVGVPDDITVECGASIPAPALVTAEGNCLSGGDVSNEGLILHYKFDDTQHLGKDSSVLGQNGNVFGVGYAANGHQGGAGRFAGQGQKIDAVSLPQPGYNLSWGAWILPEGNALFGVMGKTVSENESFYLHVRPGEALAQAYVMPVSRAEERYARNAGAIQTGTWQHVMGTYDGHTVSLYINGQLVHTNYYENLQMVRSNNVTFAVGDVGVGMGWSYKGLLDDVRVYARTLSSTEVASIAGAALEVEFVETSSTGSCPRVITRVWTATDQCGNSVSATQTITVLAAPPVEVDTDGDGLLDSTEKRLGTDPKNPDTDGDGRSDGLEVQMGTNPLIFNAFPHFVRNDFDGDLISDIGVYAHASGAWHIFRSRAGYQLTQYGFYGTTPVPGDYDGDKKADFAVFDPANYVWYILGSGGKSSVVQWGFRGTVPVPADYDGDGRTDIAVYHARFGLYYVNGTKRGTFYKRVFLLGGQPVVGDFDGDRAVDFAVYQPSSAKWKVSFQSGGSKTFSFGDKNSRGVAGDYDGDGRADFATFNPVNGLWNILGSTSGPIKIAMPEAIGGQPVTGYYYARSGNYRVDPAVYLPFSGEWVIWGGEGIIMRTQFGDQTTTPLGAGP